MKLCIIPIGEDVAVDLLDDLTAALAHTFQISCHVTETRLDAAFSYDAKRNQYWSTALLKRMLEDNSPDTRLLGITELDLFVPVLTFVFGEAQVGGRAAIVSLHRLRNEFYGLPPEPGLLSDRLIKESVHELGHTYGLRHCDDWQCVMTSSHAVEKLDTKSSEFCSACYAVVNPDTKGTVLSQIQGRFRSTR